LFLLLAAAAFYVSARRAGLSGGEAWTAAAIAALLPAFQVSAFFATAFVYPLAVVLAAVAAWASGQSSFGHRLLGFILLTAGMWIYQTAATAFVAFVALAWLARPDAPDVKRRLASGAATFVAACGAAYGCVRLVGVLYPAERIERAKLLTDVPGKMRWFAAQPAIAAFDLVRLRPSVPLAVGVALFLSLGMAFWLRQRGPRWGVGLVAVGTLIPLSYLPNLVIAENWFSYRTLIGTSTLLVVLLVISARGWTRQLGLGQAWCLGALGVCFCISLVAAIFQMNRYVIGPQRAELAALERLLDGVSADRICLVPATEASTLAPFVRSDEFGRPSTATPWARADAVAAVLRSRDHNARIPQVSDGPCPGAVGAVTIDVDSALRNRRL
jgi:hypothetical protein